MLQLISFIAGNDYVVFFHSRLAQQGYYGGNMISSEKQSELTQEFGSRIIFYYIFYYH